MENELGYVEVIVHQEDYCRDDIDAVAKCKVSSVEVLNGPDDEYILIHLGKSSHIALDRKQVKLLMQAFQ